MLPARADAARPARRRRRCPTTRSVCSCNNVTQGRDPRRDRRARLHHRAREVKKCTKAGTRLRRLRARSSTRLLDAELARERRRGRRQGLCEHFALPAQELFEIVLACASTPTSDCSTATVARRHGRGDGCEICKPAVASILARATLERLRPRRRARDAPGHQRPLPRQHPAATARTRSCRASPAARSRPEKLIVIGEVARDFGLYTKITGGQRIDLFGARVEQLPAIWEPAGRRRLRVRPRLRQGAAHREVLRRLDLVPLRRAGLRRPRDRARAALPRAARRRTSSSRRSSRLHPRVRRGAEQGLRRDRHREGLEPLRRRQRRREAAPRRPAGRGPRRRER